MNRMRFGALLLMRGRRFGFYLSHRVVLTVPKPSEFLDAKSSLKRILASSAVITSESSSAREMDSSSSLKSMMPRLVIEPLNNGKEKLQKAVKQSSEVHSRTNFSMCSSQKSHRSIQKKHPFLMIGEKNLYVLFFLPRFLISSETRSFFV